jgi:hypothetical protein
VVILGWVLGYVFWQPESPGGQFEAYFDFFVPTLTLLCGIPLAIAAGVLLGAGSRRARVAGYAALVGTCIVLIYLASFSFFGGFCLDPGDVCVTTWPSRIAELGVAMVCVAVGSVAHHLRGRRPT